MATWKFEERPEHLLEQDLTQRDQFNNNYVGLSEALVREVIQNSTDAANGIGPVQITFQISILENSEMELFRELVLPLKPHLSVVGIDTNTFSENSIRLLTVEDFNTKGLTGEYERAGDGNFYNFWKRHGRSVKTGKLGGRWGLGKLVYSSASRIRSFFGITIQKGSDTPLLMGQSVLKNHEIDEKKFYWYGYYANRDDKQFQLPETDQDAVEKFCKMVSLTRNSESGLSVVIPYLNDSITTDELCKDILNNYYFPIHSGSLVVNIDDRVIDANNFDEAVITIEKQTDGTAKNLNLIPMDFVKNVNRRKGNDADFIGTEPITAQVSENYFDTDALSNLRDLYSDGHLIRAILPVELQNMSGEFSKPNIDVFLQKLPEGAHRYSLFVRGSITVPTESRWFDRHAYGAMIAMDEDIASFLGDAENPAHTEWNENAGKLTERWKTPYKSLRAVRHALTNLYNLIGQEQETRDQDALIDFFSLADDTQCSRKGKEKNPVPAVPPLPQKQEIRIVSKEGGFALSLGPAAAKWEFPKSIQIRAAYNMLGSSNPIVNHSSLDFDFTKPEIEMSVSDGKLKKTGVNTLHISIHQPSFKFQAGGFDKNRDLLVTVETGL